MIIVIKHKNKTRLLFLRLHIRQTIRVLVYYIVCYIYWHFQPNVKAQEIAMGFENTEGRPQK